MLSAVTAVAMMVFGGALAQPAEPLPPSSLPATPATPTHNPGEETARPTRRFIGLWITRFDYRTEADVVQCIERAADFGATDVIWQVRGQADAFYKSDLEPWGEELLAGLPDGMAPVFDPLAVAVEQAHKHGLKLHAWVNIMPLWKGKTPPPNPKHPYLTHPEWRMRNAAGQEQALNDHYVIANPLLPAVHDHIVAVCKDIVTRYAVDGLHMDYVRFVSDTMKDPAAFPGDPESFKLFEKATGKAMSDSPESKVAFRDFKRQRITDLVRRIRKEAVQMRPGVAFTAAVWRRPDLGRDTYLQDGAVWLNEGTLDLACPMIYTDDDKQFAGDLAAWQAAAPGKPITPGLGIYLHKPGASDSQLVLCDAGRTPGYAIFSYAAMYESVNEFQEKAESKVRERAERLVAMKQALGLRAGKPHP